MSGSGTFDLFGIRLLLAGGRLGGAWIAAGLVAGVLLLVLYREERRLVARRVGLGLLGLRLAAAAWLVLALFEPIAARTVRNVVPGRLIVAVDVSESMATADPGRSADERARLARALRMGPGASAEVEVEAMPRREVARRLIATEGAAVARIAREHAVSAVAFDRATAPATLDALADALGRPGRPDDPDALTTDWGPALAEALQTPGPDQAPVVGVVLLTDGRQNGPGDGDPRATADRLSARGIPVFPLLIGSTRPPRDAAVASVQAPESVYLGDVAHVAATLKLDGYDGHRVAVTLERPGASPIHQEIDAPADGSGSPSRPVVDFRVPMDEVGTVPLTVAIAPMEGDARPDNDRRTVTVDVVDDKARVLLVDGEARWEFRYLRDALARDPHVTLDAVVFHQPENENMTTTTYPDTLPEAMTGQPAPDSLGAFDVVIIGDVDPADVTPATWTRLESYVAERGGTLVLGAGPLHWPALSGDPTAHKLLPVLDPRPVAVPPDAPDPAHPSLPPGVGLRPTRAAGSDAGAWPMLQLADAPEPSRRAWSGLPRLPWVLSGRAKPGATVLVTAREDQATDGDADADYEAAVIAAQPYGLGKVFWVGTGDTWRWRHRAGDAYHHRFWGQVVRWSAAQPLPAGNALVRFGPVRPRLTAGESARLQARIVAGVAGVGPDLLAAARLFRADPRTGRATGDAVAVVPLRADAGRPRTFAGSAPPLPPGRYAVRLDVPQLAEALRLDGGPGPDRAAPEAALRVLARDTTERVELAAARDPLDRLAAATGGRVLADHEADRLPPLLRARARNHVLTHTVEVPLWDQPAALLLFLALLTVEWVARKRVGLS